MIFGSTLAEKFEAPGVTSELLTMDLLMVVGVTMVELGKFVLKQLIGSADTRKYPKARMQEL